MNPVVRETMEPGTTNFGSPVESAMGATEEEAMIGNAVEESAGVGDEIVPVTPFESASEAPRT